MKIAKIQTACLYEGMSCEIFISGCHHKCDGCQNPELWDFNYGKEMRILDILEEIAWRYKWVDNVVLSGGDPMWSGMETLKLVREIKKEFPLLPIWLYTGFTKEEIDKDILLTEIFNNCDVIITDRYKKGLPTTKLTGSDNQRVWRNPMQRTAGIRPIVMRSG